MEFNDRSNGLEECRTYAGNLNSSNLMYILLHFCTPDAMILPLDLPRRLCFEACLFIFKTAQKSHNLDEIFLTSFRVIAERKID